MTAAAAGLIATSLVFLWFHRLSSIDGAYLDPNIGVVGNAYWVFDHGRARVEMPGDIEPLGSYTNAPGGIIVWHRKGVITYESVKATVYGINMRDPGSNAKRFLWRRQFAWIPNAWDWIREHL